MANTKVTSGVIKDDAVGADQLASNSVVTASINDNAITTAKIADDAILTAKISNSAITNAKMSANSVDSDQYVDASIDTAHIRDAQITSAKLDTNISISGELTVGSHLNMGDGDILKMGASADLQIYHDASGGHSRIDDTGTGGLVIRGSQILLEKYGGGYMINAVQDGATELYYAGAKKFETTSSGVTVTGDVFASGGSFFVGNGGIVASDSTSRDLKFGIGNTTAKMTLDTSGNVGIGTSSPSAKCHLYTSTSDAINLGIQNSQRYWKIETVSEKLSIADVSAGGLARMTFDTSGNVGIGTAIPDYLLEAYNGDISSLKLTSAAGGNAVHALRFRVRNSGNTAQYATLGTVSAETVSGWGGVLTFSTKPASGSPDESTTERMRIDSSGVLHINGSTSYGNANHLTIATGGANVQAITTNSTSSSAHYIGRFYSGGTEIGNIYYNGSATAYNTSSDYRLKENVNYDFNALDRISQLKPARFNFINNINTTVNGFLAHEVQDIVPEAITGEKDAVDDEGNPEYQGIDQSKLVPLLTKAIQEQQAQIETLKQEIQELKE